MQLSKEELTELNILLRNTNIKLPDFRREVSASGKNYKWLREHILIKNPNINSRLRELLKL